ncbi:MAG: glycosyl transferase [Bdellovibrionota bacterium]
MPTEHYCTLFDSKFLPAGLCLHESLEKVAQPFHLWILCMDEAVETQLRALKLPHVSLIPLARLETSSLQAVKPGRTKAEYCWTLTPFLPAYILENDQAVSRVTYIDADLYFFASPSAIFDEFSEVGAHALITEHAYDPRYDSTATSGRFCVQFLTFRNTQEAREIMTWWQDRCLEWCFARLEEGKFGDQMYLDQWPGLFGARVHILRDTSQALAPWNANHILSGKPAGFLPVFFHFHGLRIVSPERARLFFRYRVGRRALDLYDPYVTALRGAVARIKAKGWAVPFFPETRGPKHRLRDQIYEWTGKTRVETVG